MADSEGSVSISQRSCIFNARAGANRCDFIDGRVRCSGTKANRTRCTKSVKVEDCRGDGPCPGHYCGYHKLQASNEGDSEIVRTTRLRCCGIKKDKRRCTLTVEVTLPVGESEGVFCHHHRSGSSSNVSVQKSVAGVNTTADIAVLEGIKTIIERMNIMDMRMDNLEKGKENRQAISRHFPSDAGTDVSSASTEIPVVRRTSRSRGKASHSEASFDSHVRDQEHDNVKSESEDQTMDEGKIIEAGASVKSPDVTKVLQQQNRQGRGRVRSIGQQFQSFSGCLSPSSPRSIEGARDP